MVNRVPNLDDLDAIETASIDELRSLQLERLQLEDSFKWLTSDRGFFLFAELSDSHPRKAAEFSRRRSLAL